MGIRLRGESMKNDVNHGEPVSAANLLPVNCLFAYLPLWSPSRKWSRSFACDNPLKHEPVRKELKTVEDTFIRKGLWNNIF